MSLLKNGTNTLINNCVTNITSLGFYILIENKEYFIFFNDYPEFRNANIDDIFKMKVLYPNQLRWDKLDIDIEIDALQNPDKFNLKYV